MQIRNVMESVVKTGLHEILHQQEKYHIAGACFCERCLLDITALALNRLPPRYVVCDQGEAYVRTGFLDQQFEVDVLYAILEAIRVVQENPRH